MLRLITLITLSFIVLASFAQTNTISGVVTDSLGNPVSFASMSLADPADTSTLSFIISNEDGTFRFKDVKPGNYILMTARMGYMVDYLPISLERDISKLLVTMKATTTTLSGVNIRASKIPMLINGDTIVYNANSFKTQANANVEDLLNKLPGVQIKRNGDIVSEGQSITRILINGKEFFGGNLEAATKNIDAELVEKLEVIERKTAEDEFTETSDNQREKVINLVLKEEKTSGVFGTLRAGTDGQNYYRGSGNVNFFNSSTQLSVIGGGNNINRSLYGWREMQTLNSFEISPFNSGSNTSYWYGGVKTYAGVGANLHLDPTEKLSVDLAYVLGDEVNTNIYERSSEIYLTNSTLLGKVNSSLVGATRYHQVNAKLEFSPDSLNKIVARFQGKTNNVDVLDVSRTINRINIEEILNSGVNRDDNKDVRNNLTSKVHWTRKDKTRKGTFFMGSIYFGKSDADNSISSYFNTDTFLLPEPSTETPLLQQRLQTNETTIATTAAYEYQINKKWTIRPGVNAMRSEYDHSFIWDETASGRLASKSPVGEVEAFNMEYFAHFIYRLDSFTTIRLVPELNQNIETRKFTTDSSYSSDVSRNFFIPYLFIRSNKAHKYNFRFSLNGRMHRPQIQHILPVTDNSNAYTTVLGNMDLQNYMSYNNNFSYNRMFGLGKSLTFSGWSSLSLRPIGNVSSITEDNYSVTQYENFKHRMYSQYGLEFSLPIPKIKANFGVGINYGYNRNFSEQNDVELLSLQNSFSLGPRIQFNQFDKFSMDGGYDIKLNTGSIGGVENNPYMSHEISLNSAYEPIDRLSVRANLEWNLYDGNSAAGAQSIPILTSGVSYFIDKHKKWNIGLEAFDIFDKNQQLWRWWSGNSFTESRSNAVRRYVMGTLTYKIGGNKKEDKIE